MGAFQGSLTGVFHSLGIDGKAVLSIARLLTNDGIILENRRPQPKRQPAEVIRFIRRPAKRGRKLR